MVTLRPAAASDLDALSAFAVALTAEVHDDRVASQFAPKLRDEVAAALRGDPNDIMMVAEEEGRLVGCGRARILPSHPLLRFAPDERHAYIELMYVVPGDRRLGIGTFILWELERWARGRGVAYVMLHHAPHARAFYERHKYSPMGEMYKRLG